MRRLGAHQLLLMWRRRDSALGLKSIVDHLENERDWHGPVNLRAIDEESWGLAYPKLDTRTDTCILFSGVLLLYAQKRGYAGGVTQVRAVLAPWRSEGQERAFVRFETAPGEQAQMDWGHFGNWDGRRLYGFALTLCWSRMRYVEFTQRQDAETLLHCMVHAFEFFGGVTQTVLTDNIKTVVVDRADAQPRIHPKMLHLASSYGVVPRVCRPYRPKTKGKIESTIR